MGSECSQKVVKSLTLFLFSLHILLKLCRLSEFTKRSFYLVQNWEDLCLKKAKYYLKVKH